MTDFNALRQEADVAWLALNRDNREPLRDFLRHLVDAIEAVSDGKAELVQATTAFLENDSSANWDRLYEARDAALSTERRETDG